MDDVKAWIHDQGAYQVGLQLYLQHPSHNPRLVKTLSKAESFRNREKLEYELLKVYDRHPIQSKVDTAAKRPTMVRTSQQLAPREIKQEAVNSYQGGIHLSQLHPALHLKFIKQKDVFYRIWGLHYKLEDMETDDKRLQALREIMSGWEFVNAVWREIDYWLKNSKLLDSPSLEALKELSPAGLAKRQLSVRSNIKRYEKKVEELEREHKSCGELKAKNKLLSRLTKAKNTLESNELKMARIKQLLNERT